ncbi:MAG: nucleoside/nucleotide kinase family protein [Pseudomonadota bacterium]
MPPDPQLAELARAISGLPFRHKRRLIAVAGPPASGKSTLAAALSLQVSRSCVVPMDGFHLDNRLLEERGALARKGAPHTFDVAGLNHLLARLQTEEEVNFPVFDREIDRAIAGAGCVDSDTKTVLVEGNYLLFDKPGWRDLAVFWDFSLYLAVPEADLRKRLLARWHAHGYSAETARQKTEANDLPNARLVTEHLLTPHLYLEEAQLAL